jgi:putative DNA primase/helicase
MLIWSGCADVARSRFVDYQEANQDFEDFAEPFNHPQNFKPAEKKDDLPLFMASEFPELPIRRCAENVLRIHFLVVDIDKGTDNEFTRPLSLVEQYGHVLYTSFSHDPAGQSKFRILVKLTRPVDITEWAAFFPRALHHLELLQLADLKCADAAHMYYVPGGDPKKYFCSVGAGPGLDVDGVLQLPLPEGYKVSQAEGPKYSEILPEEERGEITEGLRDYFEGKLQILVNEIYARPYPGSYYDLKSHEVFGIARGAPHIIDPERIRTMVKIAITGRYRNAGVLAHADVEVLRQKSFEQVDQAIDEALHRPWWPPVVNEIPVRPFTELGLAERFVDQHREDICYEPSWESWLIWNSKHWDQKAGAILVQERMSKTVRKVPDEANAHLVEYWQARELFQAVCADANSSDELKANAEFAYEEKKKLIEAIRAFGLKCETFAKISAATKLARHQPQVVADHMRFNANPWLLNFQNGTVDLRTGEFREHRREDYITRIVPHTYDPNATCPLFDRFLSECMVSNERMIAFLWRALGYSSVGVTDEQKMFMLHGDGANGKSTFLTLMLDLFGQHGVGYGFAANSSNLLTTKGSEQHPTWRMDFAGVRFLGANEVEEGRAFAESLIKELTGSDPITGRKMRQDNWTYRPEYALWLAMNHLPHIRGTDEGIWRRIAVVEWNANFEGRADKELPRKLLAEASGIWARIVREARLWHREGLVLPREVVAASTRYRQEQDPLKDFVERWCVIEKDGQVERSHLWAAYEEYCNDTRQRTFHERKRFYAAMEKQFTIKTIKGLRLFAGVRLKTPKERIDSMPRSILQKAATKKDETPN